MIFNGFKFGYGKYRSSQYNHLNFQVYLDFVMQIRSLGPVFSKSG